MEDNNKVEEVKQQPQSTVHKETKAKKETKKQVGSQKPKVPKGARDFTPQQMVIRNKAFNLITDIFQKHGAVEIDTPVFELKQTLMGKYGEESKLIYDLEDQGGELLSLRYDLTVPFARYLAINKITNIKRFHIGKVYRRDQPVMTKGRFREFYQCDFDIAGEYDLMLPDAEILYIVHEILTKLDVGTFQIKLSHRKLLDAIVEIIKAPEDKFKTICSSVDKLDKESWENVKKELVEVKGLDLAMADKLGEFVKLKGEPLQMLNKLKTEKIFDSSEKGKQALEELEVLFKYLQAFGCLQSISLDLSLARGLDYYTGLIYETVLTTENGVGSISAGGRYDELVGMFSGKKIPAVGVSIGIERVFILLEEKFKKQNQNLRQNQTEIIIATLGKSLCEEKLKLCHELWENGIKTEIVYSANPKPQKQLSYALDSFTPFMAWIGENEVKEGVVTLKCMYTGVQAKVERAKFVDTLKTEIKKYYEDLANGVVVFKEKEQKK